MSNVLMGILGVILFIGMALTGASYFGENVQDGQAQAKATRIAADFALIGQAVQDRVYATGTMQAAEASQATAGARVASLVTDGYLKSTPAPPVGSSIYQLLDRTAGTNGQAAAFLVLSIGSTSEARATCYALERLSGQSGTLPHIESGEADLGGAMRSRPRAGCFRSITYNAYLAYTPVGSSV
ncbi:hypothetical protein [Sphingosinicella sp. BN140058]|uniref:hypothetical protein n=1 Tax=Sphingosinicella sp. BN140058 TaxID=1892855 RepID=UPI001013ABD2|nr:hypothetical protein [Sphingosinicella sp. BN140058]QAY80267.1 hypothetical protein ETR14_26855 [Sphingosinicella sp. BN140058]